MLKRVLEPEVMDESDEVRAYDSMDHRAANTSFVDDLLCFCPSPGDVLDVGTGTAQIPVELCRRTQNCRVMAADMSRAMLEQARYHIEVHGMIHRIQLDLGDANRMLYQDGMFDLVMCNGTLHHFAQPNGVLSEAVRVTAEGGCLFFRDLLRPPDEQQLERLVTTYAVGATPAQQALLRQSLHASLNLTEMREQVAQLGFDPASVQATSDRHWTWCARKE
jgi:ubiquinone/menaquinone biosynthesis C-methylase UbiE